MTDAISCTPPTRQHRLAHLAEVEAVLLEAARQASAVSIGLGP